MDTNNATGEDATNGKQNEQEVEAQIGTENDEEKQQEWYLKLNFDDRIVKGVVEI